MTWRRVRQFDANDKQIGTWIERTGENCVSRDVEEEVEQRERLKRAKEGIREDKLGGRQRCDSV